MENHLSHIKGPLLNVTIFITHMHNLCNGCYINDKFKMVFFLVWREQISLKLDRVLGFARQ